MKQSLAPFVFILVLLVENAQAQQILGNTSESAAAGGALPDKYATMTAIGSDKYGLDVVVGGVVPGTQATFAALDATAYSAIGATYSSAVNLPDGTKVVILDNQTNGDVMVSMDGGTSDTFHVKAGDVLVLPLAQAGLSTTADVQVKDGTTASTAGTFYVYSYK